MKTSKKGLFIVLPAPDGEDKIINKPFLLVFILLVVYFL